MSKDDTDGDNRVSFDEFKGPKWDTNASRRDEL